MLGSSVAWFTASNPDFNGKILVVEKDPSYEFSSTAHTNSCMRQQFSNDVNIQVSQFAAEFVKNFRTFIGDPKAPEPVLQSFGYMYLADTPDFVETLKEAQRIQSAAGAGTQHMSPEEIARDYPFYNLEGILAANHNRIDFRNQVPQKIQLRRNFRTANHSHNRAFRCAERLFQCAKFFGHQAACAVRQ